MIRIQFFIFIIAFVGLFLIFNIDVKKLIDDVKDFYKKLSFIKKEKSLTLKQMIQEAKRERKKSFITEFIDKTKEILVKENDLSKIKNTYILSGILGTIGIIISIIIQNIFLIPILFITFASFPFVYIQITYYRKIKKVNLDLENALSNITSTYVRENTNIAECIRENIEYIRNPLKRQFEIFLYNYENINSNLKENLLELKSKIDNILFNEWIDAVINSIDDSNYKNTLPYICSKFGDERMINLEFQTKMYEPLYEYILTVIMIILSIPFTKIIGDDWYEILVGTDIGKCLIAITITIVLISTICVTRILRPIEYRA